MTKVFRDPVHDHITFSGLEEDLLPVIDTAVVQRLRRIHQNGAAFLAYHGLERSRFSHALGTYEVGRRLIERLERVMGPRAEELDIYALRDEVSMGFKAACLLHDIGHSCFSHAGERFFQLQAPQKGTELKHESWTLRILEEDPELNALISDKSWFGDARAFLAASPHPFLFLQNMFSGNLDVDRFDYLERDTQASGAGYGTADFNWLLQTMDIDHLTTSSYGSRWELVFDAGRATYAIEHILLARRSMYAQVYFHKTVRASEALLLALLLRAFRLGRYEGGSTPTDVRLPGVFGKLASGEQASVNEYLELDDVLVLRCVLEWARGDEDPLLRDMADRIVRRRLFKAIPIPEVFRPSLRDEDKVEELRQIVDGAALPSGELKEDERISDYYLALDEADRVIYSTGPASVYLRDHSATGDRVYPFEADPRTEAKFTPVGKDRSLSVAFVIVPTEALDDVRDAIARWE